MADSEEEHDERDSVNLAGFLFGNIDETGRLESDILDSESQRHLSSLTRLGLGAILSEMIGDSLPNQDNSESEDDNNGNNNQISHSSLSNSIANGDVDSQELFDQKSPSAVDFSDINELAEDDANDISKSDNQADNTDYDADDESNKYDHKLMPPPPVPMANGTEMTKEQLEGLQKRKLDTPLAAMLPSKYADVDVRELFPDFRPDKVKLAFIQLLRPFNEDFIKNCLFLRC